MFAQMPAPGKGAPSARFSKGRNAPRNVEVRVQNAVAAHRLADRAAILDPSEVAFTGLAKDVLAKDVLADEALRREYLAI